MEGQIVGMENSMIGCAKKYADPVARYAFFVVFFWFGILKVLQVSPATPLVASLLNQTLPVISFPEFSLFFGLLEMLIGVGFLWKGVERFLIPLFAVHMFTTTLPLFLLPQITWSGPLIPTLEGQYIIKNVVLLALAFTMIGRLSPISPKRKEKS